MRPSAAVTSLLFLFAALPVLTSGFSPAASRLIVTRSSPYRHTKAAALQAFDDGAPSDTGDVDGSDEQYFDSPELVDTEAVRLKSEILVLADSTKRGFSASSSDKQDMKQLVSRLSEYNPSDEPAAAYYKDSSSTVGGGSTLAGKWTLVYTDAPDITALDVPIGPAKLGRIGQECDPPLIKNVIEWLRPDWAASLPFSGTDDSRVLQKVCTSGEASPDEPTKVNLKIVGLDLEGKGTSTSSGNILDAIQQDGIPAGLLETKPISLRGPLNPPFGEFEILYLDDDMRIVRTNQGYLAINVRPDTEWF